MVFQTLRQPGLPQPQPRSARGGVSLLEVLVSMGVMTLGILGVAALFPIGSHYVQKGEIYDRADAAASAAFSDAVSRGLLNPNRWVSYETGSTDFGYDPASLPVPRSPGDFTRPFAQDMQYRMALIGTPSDEASRIARQQHLTRECGTFYVIDPLGVATGFNPAEADRFEAPPALRAVPASHRDGINLTGLDPTNPEWWWAPWEGQPAALRVSIAAAPATFNGQAFLTPPVPETTAERLASAGDDLTLELGDSSDTPSQQRMLSSSIGSVTVPTIRQVDGHYSYLLTVVPHSNEARDALAFGGRGLAYDVSAVVLHRRPRGRFDDTDPTYGGIESHVRSERMCRASVLTQTASGGEIRLMLNTDQANDQLPDTPEIDKRPWKNLREGQYVMLMGPAPGSRQVRPALFAQWYRVTSIGNEAPVHKNNTHLGPTVALRGPDWPWAPSNAIAEPTDPNDPGDYALLPDDANPAEVADDLRVLILDGAAAVHTRTLRLENGNVW